MTRLVCSSLSIPQVASCSGEKMRISWIPPAVAWVKTGPRLATTKGSSPSNAGYRLGTTRTSQCPDGP
jgi:hypothetical protein